MSASYRVVCPACSHALEHLARPPDVDDIVVCYRCTTIATIARRVISEPPDTGTVSEPDRAQRIIPPTWSVRAELYARALTDAEVLTLPRETRRAIECTVRKTLRSMGPGAVA
jgi:hypothetical protein